MLLPNEEGVPPQDGNEEEETNTEEESTEEESSEEESSAEDKSTKDSKDDESEESEESDDTKDEDEKDPPPADPVDRPVHMMPVDKAQKEKKNAVDKAVAEVRAEIEEKGADSQDWDKKLEEVAEKHGLKVDAAKALLDVFKGSLPDLSKYDKVIKDQEVVAAKTAVNTEFDAKIVDLIKKDYPKASASHIAKVKKTLTDLAFTKEFNTYKLADIYTVNKSKFAFKNKFTGETGGGRKTDKKDLANMSEEEALKLPPLEFVEWENMQEGGSRYVNVE